MHIKYTEINYTLKTMKNVHSELFCEKIIMSSAESIKL